ncbi:MAG: DUF1036 domain-containing protein [Bdellovibrionales bacterium]
MKRGVTFSGFVLFVGLFCSFPVRAAFLYCNQTSTPIEAAFGQRNEGRWLSQGWWRIAPGDCARVYDKPVSGRFYFYYARALTPPKPHGKPPRVWDGKYQFCVDKKAFKIEGDGNCEARDYRTQGFHEIDVGMYKKDYTLTFEDKK